MTATALVIGGTGPTGPDILTELLARNYRVSVLHRGVHEPSDAVLGEVEHIHADPHFAETLDAALDGRRFDLVVATYGRMRLNVEACAGRCDRFIGVGGNPVHAGHLDRHSARPSGMRVLADETSPMTEAMNSDRDRFAARVRAAEQTVFSAAGSGAFAASYLRYPMVYGRRSMLGFERGLVARMRAGRTRIVLPDGGLSIYSRMADRNAAHMVGLVVDHGDITDGRVYQCADDKQYSVRQWAELCCAAVGGGGGAGGGVEFVAVPLRLCRPSWDLLPTGPDASQHTLVDISRARRELGYHDVVDPIEVLTEVMGELWADAGSTSLVRWDASAEDAVLAAHDQMGATLAEQLGGEPPAADERWHPYAHPTEPISVEPARPD